VSGHLSAKTAPHFKERRFDVTSLGGDGSIAYRATESERVQATTVITSRFAAMVASELLLMLGLEQPDRPAPRTVCSCGWTPKPGARDIHASVRSHQAKTGHP
jgi:hypothetical protein